MLQVLFFLSFICSYVYSYTQAALKDQITSLPGLPANANFTMFSGYINVNANTNKNIFYWFILSMNDSSKDPLVLWTNGGPGCSGLLGLMTEQGPFRAQPDGSLEINDYTWVTLANMVFIETPVGVGFSYSDDPSDYTIGDSQTAIDNYNFILGFLEKFPEFQKHEFYISSESYGGHYMPTLAKQIILGNQNTSNTHINFKGVFVGNPLTDPVENAKGTYDTWWGHQLIPKVLHDEWYYNCSDGSVNSDYCYNLEVYMTNAVGNLDPYALDFPVCPGSILSSGMEKYHFLKTVVYETFERPMPKLYKTKYDNLNMEYQACSEEYETSYLNTLKVKEALHVYNTSTYWNGCSNLVNYSNDDIMAYMEPVWQWLVENGNHLHMTIISGDDDSVCGTLGTQSWLWNMGWELDNDIVWETWTDNNDQVAGYLTKFKNGFGFVTVHTAGHMIPQTQPERSLLSFKYFLAGRF